MLSFEQKELLRDKTYELLSSEGIKIENDQIVQTMLNSGCEENASGRIRIPRQLIDELAGYQKQTQEQDALDQELLWRCGPDWAHDIIWHGKQESFKKRMKSEFLMSAFDCGPTLYYDYALGKSRPVDDDIHIEMCKFAQATDEIGYMSTWYRQSASPKIERIESLVTGLKYTDKLAGIEAIYPEVIKYLKEASEIITDSPGDSSYLAGSECITSPLILESRSAQDILERKNCGVHRYHVASMPTMGLSTPVTVAGSTIMTAAEILGGMAVCHVIDPGSDLSGRAIALMMNMKTAANTSAAPEVTLVNMFTKELFDAFWGGHLWVEVFFSTYALRPGLQAVSENLTGSWRYAKLLNQPGIGYPGMGTLGTGAVGSPTQFMLDMDIRKSEFAMDNSVCFDEAGVAFDEICDVVREDGNFLTGEHTLEHFRKLWSSNLFLTDVPGQGAWKGDEKAILDKCDQMWRENVKNYCPPDFPADKMKALEGLLSRAKKDFQV